MLDENRLEGSFTLLFQDNSSKMKQTKIKITMDADSYVKHETYANGSKKKLDARAFYKLK